MTDWTWKFFDALVVNEDGLTDVLREVNYLLRGTRGEGEDSKSYEIGGRTALGPVNQDSFIPFEYLTPENLTVILSSVLNIEAMKKQIDIWFDAEASIKPLPFN